ncbi:MAG: ligase-associated DNA damage response endonuclease PdeM [Bacteroidetes bacterium]|nr:ligase-associated DNA damage response endonuclease PdeM [Bacteroidota bacterium]
MQLNLHNQTFLLSEHKALFWLEQKMLIIADAHFSKETHFRKNGVAIPAGILQNDLRRMETMIDTFDPDQILFLGDMFHSEENDGLNEFLNWRKTFSSLKITLVIGNHDILINEWYTHAKIDCIKSFLQIENIILSHDKMIMKDENNFNLYGHIHPGILLRGKAKQSLRLPCFWFSKNYGALPAFGRFTGSVSVRPNKEDQVFVIGDGKVFDLQQ